MRRERTFKKSLLFLAIMSIMIFAMSITASAAATNIKQTEGKGTYVSISWRGTSDEDAYKVYYSKSGKAGTYKADDANPTHTYSQSTTIFKLTPGSTYYIKIESYRRDSNYDYKKYATSGAFQVVTAPSDIEYKNIKQTAGTPTSVTVAWKKSAGASGYIVSKNNGASKTIAKNAIKFSASEGKEYSLTVTPYKKSKSGFVAKAYSTTKSYLQSSPSAPINVADGAKENLTWMVASKTNYPTIYWDKKNNQSPDGYQVEIYTVDGKKKLSAGSCKTRYISIKSSKVNSIIKNKGFKVRVRSYIKKDNAVCYSKWSAMKTVIPQANVKFTQTSSTSARAAWTKVANTTKYIVYVCKDVKSGGKGHWTKKTVSASTTSINISGLTPYQDFGVYVIPVVKIGGKQYSADHTWYTYSWTRR